jgi:hypothetical protein
MAEVVQQEEGEALLGGSVGEVVERVKLVGRKEGLVATTVVGGVKEDAVV